MNDGINAEKSFVTSNTSKAAIDAFRTSLYLAACSHVDAKPDREQPLKPLGETAAMVTRRGARGTALDRSFERVPATSQKFESLGPPVQDCVATEAPSEM